MMNAQFRCSCPWQEISEMNYYSSTSLSGWLCTTVMIGIYLCWGLYKKYFHLSGTRLPTAYCHILIRLPQYTIEIDFCYPCVALNFLNLAHAGIKLRTGMNCHTLR